MKQTCGCKALSDKAKEVYSKRSAVILTNKIENEHYKMLCAYCIQIFNNEKLKIHMMIIYCART